MAAWTNLIEMLHRAALGAFGVSAIWTPQGTGTATPITGIIQKPGQMEDVFPGSAGSSVVRLFVAFSDFSPEPQHGDTVTLAGGVYVIQEIDVDIEGGAVLKLRIT